MNDLNTFLIYQNDKGQFCAKNQAGQFYCEIPAQKGFYNLDFLVLGSQKPEIKFFDSQEDLKAELQKIFQLGEEIQ